jgi:transcription termination factor Rho
MDKDPIEELASEELVSEPKKRVLRKTATETTVRKPRTKKTTEVIPETFSVSSEKSSIACEYSNLIGSVEDWSPMQVARSNVSEETPVLPTRSEVVPLPEGKTENTNCPTVQNQANDHSGGEVNNHRNERNAQYDSRACHNPNRVYQNKENLANARGNNGAYHVQRNENNRNRTQNMSQNNTTNRRRPMATVRIGAFSIGYLRGLEYLNNRAKLDAFCAEIVNGDQPPLYLNEVLEKSHDDLVDLASSINLDEASSRGEIIDNYMASARSERRPIIVKGILESMEGGDGIIIYGCEHYKIRAKSTFVPRCLIQSFGLRRGQTLTAIVHPPLEQSTCPFAVRISDVLGKPPEEVSKFPRFKDLVPYYPTKRIFLEQQGSVNGDNLSMRVIDLLSPIGFGQRGLVVAPPRTGKTILLQGIANAIIHNQPKTKLIVLLIDERPEEVTDFARQVGKAEIVSSTFDESAESHVHAAEIVIENARRWVEAGEHVVILLDSITRLARAYNTEQPSSGKILSGGVEANALQLPKRFFGSARNIEGGGSLTIIATALVETGSRMDDVIFEEFKGTGNMELHLDRSIADKRIFPAINLERSGTRKEELLYHPDELAKIYNLRRVFQGTPSIEAMEMLIARVKKCPTNVEFLMNINR